LSDRLAAAWSGNMAKNTNNKKKRITLSQIADATRAISRELDERKLLDVLAKRVAQIVKPDGLLLHRIASDGTVTTPVAIRNGMATSVADENRLNQLQHNWRICKAADTGSPLFVSDVDSSLNRCLAQIEEQETGSYCCIPLVCGTRTYGCLNLRRRLTDGFSESELGWLAHLGQVAAMALRALEALKLNQRQAATDPLTGLHNQRHLTGLLRREQLLLDRRGGLACLMVVDIDGLKGINEQFGPATGDRLVKSVAEVLTSIIRQTDEVARSGGDEFVVLLRDCSVANAWKVSDSILAKARTALADVDGHDVKASLHVGLSGCPEHTTRLAEGLDLARHAITSAKRSGTKQIAIPATSGS